MLVISLKVTEQIILVDNSMAETGKSRFIGFEDVRISDDENYFGSEDDENDGNFRYFFVMITM